MEITALSANHERLNSYSKRPDCFRRVASQIRSTCEVLETQEAERITVAISLTLCELATATHHSLPLECAPFSSESGIPASDDTHHGDCVDALSRSAQFWSSYSGYLREPNSASLSVDGTT
ncbi:RING finger protein [Mycena indigotica]|uniref:RING finger protein n=1 Tax=Mycena indigotica TaxID=2126181 RepID=A0A8H6VVP2_9AGAR|nr:RING finger protein [Mycena indigotica]KAF7289974.1 RING finger protein [Mycena indigotica]